MNRKTGIIAGSIAILAISYVGWTLPAQAATVESAAETAVVQAQTYEATAKKKPQKKVIGIEVTNIKKRAATFTWKKRKRATYYKVQIRQNGEVVHKWPNHKKRKRRVKKSHKILQAGQTYRIRVKACNEKGCGPWSKKIKFTTQVNENALAEGKGEEFSQEVIEWLEQETFDLINDYREEQGLQALVRNSDIDALAREHSANMASGAVEFGHDGFDDRFAAMLLMVPDGAASGAENVAYTGGVSYELIPARRKTRWVDSDGHRHNIEGDFVTSGMGVAVGENGRYYFTQLFLSDAL